MWETSNNTFNLPLTSVFLRKPKNEIYHKYKQYIMNMLQKSELIPILDECYNILSKK